VTSRERDPTEIVRRGYDALGEAYLAARLGDVATRRYLERALDALPPGGRALDLGCGPGRPVAAALAERGRVVGVDLSWTQLRLARMNAPSAALIQGDIARIAFGARSFDLVVSFYVLNHLSRELLAPTLRRIGTWLRPRGTFVASFGAGDDRGSVEQSWLGVPMFFSGYEPDVSRSLVGEAGFVDIQTEVVTQREDGADASFLWTVARAPEETVRILPYETSWPAAFERERDRLLEIYGEGAVAIEHIGSTAVPALAAKPIIDILVGLRSLRSEDLRIEEMERIGYEHRGSQGIVGREFFGKGRPRTVHVHVVGHGTDQWRVHVAFRNLLRADPGRAHEYEALKRTLAERYGDDRGAYTEGKSEFIASALSDLRSLGSSASRFTSRGAAPPDARAPRGPSPA
jgi:GrpB-like predicted nucleotidyltransferase (UPF0157 family)